MAAREVCFLISTDGDVLWSDAGDSAFALPDSRDRWSAIWNAREQLLAIAHSHPKGPRAFSHEDVTTMDALDAALGKPMTYVVVAPDGLVVRGPLAHRIDERDVWVAVLKIESGM